jgi:hypothetical protein
VAGGITTAVDCTAGVAAGEAVLFGVQAVSTSVSNSDTASAGIFITFISPYIMNYPIYYICRAALVVSRHLFIIK